MALIPHGQETGISGHGIKTMQAFTKYWIGLMGGVTSVACWAFGAIMMSDPFVHWTFWFGGIICACVSAFVVAREWARDLVNSYAKKLQNAERELAIFKNDPGAGKTSSELDRLIGDAAIYKTWIQHGQETPLFKKAVEQAILWESEVDKFLSAHFKSDVEYYESRRLHLPAQLFPSSMKQFFDENIKLLEDIRRRRSASPW